MYNRYSTALKVCGLFTMLIAVPACGHNVNKSITVDAGSQTGAQSSVNGSITVGEGAVINGSLGTVNGSIRIAENVTLKDAETVNGAIRIAAGSSADDVSSVNGSIELGDNVELDGSIEVVNGRISLGSGTKVGADVSNVNGEILLTAAQIGGGLSTVNGDVTLAAGSVLQGDLLVDKPGGGDWKNRSRKPKIVIGQNSIVNGEIVLEREVELYISESAEVGGVSGEMSMADAVRFSGSSPY
jgi:hypothetical protein